MRDDGLSWVGWCDAVKDKLRGNKISHDARAWLYREAYGDSYTVEEAVRIAKRKTTYFPGADTQGWAVPKDGSRAGNPILPTA